MKIKELLNKDNLTEVDYLNAILEVSTSSPKFGVIAEYEGKKIHEERANLNVMIALPLGGGKTTNLLKIANGFYLNDLTFPGVIGTINREGELIEGGVISSAGKVLILDEFNAVPKDVKEALNQILEQKWYGRNLAYKLKSNVRKKGKFYEVVGKGNWFKIRARLSCIASTMYMKFREKSYINKALFSRFVPIRFIPNYEYYEKMSRGEVYLEINPEDKVVDRFVFEDYLKAHEMYWSWFKTSKYKLYFDRNVLEQGALVRMLQDFVRISAFLASLDNRTDIRMEDFELAFTKFREYVFDNYLFYSLDERTKLLLDKLVLGLSQTEIADELGVSKSWISKRIRKLEEKGLIKSGVSSDA